MVLVMLLLSVGVASADKLSVTVEPATVSPGDQYTLTVDYSLDAATTITNVAQLYSDGVLVAEASVPLTLQTDPPLPAVSLVVPDIAGVDPVSATATLPDGSTVGIAPSPDGSVNALMGDMLPGQVVALVVTMLVL